MTPRWGDVFLPKLTGDCDPNTTAWTCVRFMEGASSHHPPFLVILILLHWCICSREKTPRLPAVSRSPKPRATSLKLQVPCWWRPATRYVTSPVMSWFHECSSRMAPLARSVVPTSDYWMLGARRFKTDDARGRHISLHCLWFVCQTVQDSGWADEAKAAASYLNMAGTKLESVSIAANDLECDASYMVRRAIKKKSRTQVAYTDN